MPTDPIAPLMAAAARLTAAIDKAAAHVTGPTPDVDARRRATQYAHAVAADIRATVPPLLPGLATLPAAELRDALTLARDLLTAGDMLMVAALNSHH